MSCSSPRPLLELGLDSDSRCAANLLTEVTEDRGNCSSGTAATESKIPANSKWISRPSASR